MSRLLMLLSVLSCKGRVSSSLSYASVDRKRYHERGYLSPRDGRFSSLPKKRETVNAQFTLVPTRLRACP